MAVHDAYHVQYMRALLCNFKGTRHTSHFMAVHDAYHVQYMCAPLCKYKKHSAHLTRYGSA